MTPGEEPLSIKMIVDYEKRRLKALDMESLYRDIRELSGFRRHSKAYKAVMVGQMLRDPALPLAMRQELLRQVGQSSYDG